MSYREIRNFTEMMRALGYPRLLSVENFRVSNFQLVAEILRWLAVRYEPFADIPKDLETEQGRVSFIKTIAESMLRNVHVKLNTKRLYQADGYAVKELLKVAQVLYDAIQLDESASDDVTERDNQYDVAINRLSDLKEARQIASEITQRGAQLYDSLSKEEELRIQRAEVLAKPLEISQVEQVLQRALQAMQEDITKTQSLIENVARDEAALDAKIEKRQQELERAQGRLENMRAVRPAYMDEYIQLEQQLAKLHEEYAVKYRCLAYLDQQMEEMEQVELEKAKEREENIKKMMQKRLERERRGEGDGGEGESDQEEEEGDPDSGIKGGGGRESKREERPVTRRREPTGRKVIGSMTGDDQADSDSDLDIGGGDLSESSDDDDELNMADMGAVRPTQSLKHTSNNNNSMSDNDF